MVSGVPFGLAWKTLRIDLGRGKVVSEPSVRYFEFLGGRGVGAKVLFDEVGVNVGPYDPENLLVFSPGLLVGTGAPQATRTNIGSKNPNTGGVGYANVGGGFGSRLRRAGFDNLIFSGRASEPVYLWVSDGSAEIRRAADLWGRGVYETEDRIRDEVGNSKVSVASIGPAGENRTFASAVIVDRGHAAGGCALASVMGSKNLKAVAAWGEGQIRVADPAGLEELRQRILGRILATEHSRLQRSVGSYGRVLPGFQARSMLPVRNYQDDHWDDEKVRRLLGIERYRRGMIPCDESCHEPCMQDLELGEGRYAGTGCVGLQANSGYGFGPRFDIDDPEVVIAATAVCNDLGIDIDNASTIISWAFELFEKGIVTRDDTGGLDLRWGDGESLLALLRGLALRSGFGNVLADGFRYAAQRIGGGSEYYAMQVKGQGIIDSVRTAIAWGFGHMVSTRGARHLDGSPTIEARDFPPEVVEMLFGVSTPITQTSYEGKARLVFWFENYKALTDCLGVCYFSSYWGTVEKWGPEDYAAALKAVSGVEMSGEELLRLGWRVHELEKAFNTIHAGFSRRDDMPPVRVFDEPVRSGRLRGQRLDFERYGEMLSEYYGLHGWDRGSGWQRRDMLERLGLRDVAERLERYGRIGQ